MAIALLLIFGAGAIAIDLGSAWETKRESVIDTDAAALAGAKALDGGDCTDAEAAAELFLASNTGQPSVDLTPDVDFVLQRGRRDRTGRLTAQAQQTLSGALGRTPSTSTPRRRHRPTEGTPGGGLRPFSVCMTDPAVSAWISDGAGAIHRLDVTKTWQNKAKDNCQGGAPGNWGYVCYQKGKHNAGACSTQTIIDLVLDGYDGTVDLQDSTPTDGDCDAHTAAVEECDPITGSTNSSGYQDALDEIECPAAETPDSGDCAYQFADPRHQFLHGQRLEREDPPDALRGGRAAGLVPPRIQRIPGLRTGEPLRRRHLVPAQCGNLGNASHGALRRRPHRQPVPVIDGRRGRAG